MINLAPDIEFKLISAEIENFARLYMKLRKYI